LVASNGLGRGGFIKSNVPNGMVKPTPIPTIKLMCYRQLTPLPVLALRKHIAVTVIP
jgi:hypothetical protein